jgi:phosphohistidine phosphatase
MRLYLIQHGEATPEDVNPSRPLTPKGSQELNKIASFLAQLDLGPISIRHSGKLRARQTAEIISAPLGPGYQVRQSENLSPNDPVRNLIEEIKRMTADLMIVGHLPFLGKLASTLLTGSESTNPVAFRQGGVVCLQRKEDQTWQVVWMVTPDILVS